MPFGAADGDIRRLRKVAIDWAHTELLLRTLEHRQRLLQKEIAKGLGRAKTRLEWAQKTLKDIGPDSPSKRAEGLRRVLKESLEYINDNRPVFDQAAAQVERAYGDARLLRERHSQYNGLIKGALENLNSGEPLSDRIRAGLRLLVPRPEHPMPKLVDVIQPALRHVLGINPEQPVDQAMRTIQAGAMAEMHALIKSASREVAAHPERYGLMPSAPSRTARQPTAEDYQPPVPPAEAARQSTPPGAPQQPSTPAARTPASARPGAPARPPAAPAPSSPRPLRPATVPHTVDAAESASIRKIYSAYQFKVFDIGSDLVDGKDRARNHIVAAVNLTSRVRDRLMANPTYLDELASLSGTVLCLPTMREAEALKTMADAAADATDKGLPTAAAIAAVVDSSQPLHQEYADLRRRSTEREAGRQQQKRELGKDGPAKT